jgi:hypothetical protein
MRDQVSHPYKTTGSIIWGVQTNTIDARVWPTAGSHPQHTQISSNSSTIAADNSTV